MSRQLAVLLVLAAAPYCTVGEEDGHDDHGHTHDEHEEEHEYEFGALYETPEDSYILTLQKRAILPAGYAYAAPSMKVALLPAGTFSIPSYEVLHGLESEADHSLEANCTLVNVGATFSPEEDACKTLTFDGRFFRVQYAINTSSISHMALFSEHHFAEFEANITDDHGHALEALAIVPTATDTNDAGPDRAWGETIGASLVVLAVTLIGVILMSPQMRAMKEKNATAFDISLSSFAAGAILATALFFLAVESQHLMASEWQDETEVTWRWGTMVLAGVLTPFVVDIIVHTIAGTDEPLTVMNTAGTIIVDDWSGALAAKEEQKDMQLEMETPGHDQAWVRIMSSVIVGDFLHNFVDGIFIGTAFMFCGRSFGWAVVAATTYHELPQELSDYFLLTERCGFSRIRALAVNFLAGISVTVGAIVILATDIESHHTGLILAYGAGTYIQISTVECLPRVYSATHSVRSKLLSIMMFVLGAVAIGVVLIDHDHCSGSPSSSSSSGDAHAGHAH